MKSLLLFLVGAIIMTAQTPFDALIDRFFEDQFRFHPSRASAFGFHGSYDAQFEDYSASNYKQQIATDQRYLDEFAKMPSSDERDLVMSSIRADLLDIEQTGRWKKNPDFYSSSVTESIFGLISRKFAPAEQRIADVIAREQRIPQVFAEAKRNLKNPPRIYTEVALEQLPGIRSFFSNDVPAAFTEVKDQRLSAEFKNANAAVLDALQAYEQWLRADLLPRSQGDFRIGAENYQKKLLYEEMVDVPLPRLLEIGYQNLRANQQQLLDVCKRIDATKTPQQIAEKLESDHPPADQLLQTFRNTLGGLIDFINNHKIVTIPSDVRPILEETPPFERALTTASMDTPGPYEKVATEAYFNVTLPEKSWSAKETQEFMTAFNRGTIVSTAIHEAYPGHYVQLLWFQKVHSKVRKLIQCGTNIEGWAHYTEQMMLDEGYGNGDAALRAGQLLDALLRNCRYIVGIEMHTRNMTYDQGIQFFMKEGYMSRAYAERETKRGTSDPTYLVYTLGKLQIMKLRDDYRKKTGPAFSLEGFHNEFMQQGGVPIKLIRRAMLGDDSPTL